MTESENRYDGRRSESFDCIALTGDAEGGSRHEGYELPPEMEIGEAVPSDAKERQRWTETSSTSARPVPKTRRVGSHEATGAASAAMEATSQKHEQRSRTIEVYASE